jgi:hypothetical protein
MITFDVRGNFRAKFVFFQFLKILCYFFLRWLPLPNMAAIVINIFGFQNQMFKTKLKQIGQSLLMLEVNLGQNLSFFE